MTRSERWLRLFLRVGAAVTGTAFLAIFLPESVMASMHASLGLGAFPATPLTSYLTRSLSAMYAFHGLMLWALSRDVRRYRTPIEVLAWGTVGIGVVLTAIDLEAPMPAWWAYTEGPGVVAIGIILVVLARRTRSVPE